jgi:diaminobutyrate-2-oxoglutarate transaminase
VRGNRYLDFLAGAGALNYGHNNPYLKKVLLEYIESDSITHGLDLQTLAKERFLTTLQDVVLQPRGMKYVVQFTGPTGTNAVEAACKLARKVTGRADIVCFTNGFHGMSLGSLAATGNRHARGGAGVPLWGASRMPFCGYFGDKLDTVEYLDRLLSDASSGVDLPAAVLLEVVQAEGGLKVASDLWLQRLEALCRRHGILLIVDDIQAGCGRTGTFFSFESAGIEPDLITLSKSLSGYGLPLAVVLIKPHLDQWTPGEHNGTFRGNNHAFVTGAEALELYWTTDAFSKQIMAKGEYLGQRLRALTERFSPHLVQTRGRGMMRGVECADAELAASVTANAFRRGLIIERCGPHDEVVKCIPPLTTTTEELQEAMDIVERAFAEETAKQSAELVSWQARA